MDRRRQELIGVAVLLLAILSISLFWKFYKDTGGSGFSSSPKNNCWPLEMVVGNASVQYFSPYVTCKDGAWVPDNLPAGQSFSYCEGYFYAVTVTNIGGELVVNKTEVGNNYCEDGKIIVAPRSCGNWQCDAGETAGNCWFDCGPMQSWPEMKKESEKPSLGKYVAKADVFDPTSLEVDKLNREIMAEYNPKSPAEAVKALTRELSQRLSYVPSGPDNPQVGDTPEIILKRKTANCVDYTVVMVSALRHGFDIPGVGVVRIPARQVGGCLSNAGFGGIEYRVVDDQFSFRGQVLAHVWTEVWGGEYLDKPRWGMADPTTNTAIMKQWFGYFRVGDTDKVPLYYLPVGYNEACKAF